MSDSHLKRVAVLVLLVVAILAGSLYLIAKPHSLPAQPAPASQAQAPAPMPQTSRPTVTWSVPQLSQTMFPGSSARVTVSFQSDQNLAGVAVDVTPSLDGIVSASPASFAAITANQPYQITLTLTVPPGFIKRSFGGTIHVRNAGNPPNTYAPALAVNLQTDWNAVSPDNLFTINLPLEWQITEVPSSGTHTFAVKLPDGTTVGWLYIYTPQQWTAIQQADVSPVLLSQTGGFIYSYGDSEDLSPDEMSATTEFAHALTSFQAH